MGIVVETVTVHTALCDWPPCSNSIVLDPYRGRELDAIPLPEGWFRDWDSGERHPPVFCSVAHLDRAARVRQIMEEKD